MTIIYDLIFLVYAVLYFPYLIIRGKWHPQFKMRFGHFPQGWRESLSGQKTIWIHAVSVGEVLVVSELIKRLKEQYPAYQCVCSTVTPTGQQLAYEQFGDKCQVIYAPLDFSWVVLRFIDQIQPNIYIAAETEIWPNLYTALKRKSVPIMMINGRISDKAYQGYKRFKFLTRKVLTCVSRFYMQSPTDADRIRQLGAQGSLVHVSGNLKFDVNFDVDQEMAQGIGYQKPYAALVAGSTHPGEEKILLDVYAKLKERHEALRLILAPRHVERTQEVADLVKQSHYQPRRLSDLNAGIKLDGQDVIIVDMIGKLRSLYALAQYVFIGKTLAVGGGQNMIEPAFLGKPVITGPMTQNFKDVMYLLKKNNAVVQVEDGAQLEQQLDDLITNSDRAKAMGDAARAAVRQNQGATDRTMNGIIRLLEGEKRA